jgi:hypothetical protein
LTRAAQGAQRIMAIMSSSLSQREPTTIASPL